MEVPSCWSNGQRACPYLTIQLWIQLIMNEKRCRVLPIKKNKSNCGFNLSSHWRLLADAYEITRSCYFFNRNCFSKYFFLHQKLNELAGPIETLERRRRHLSLCVCDRPRWKLKKKKLWLTDWLMRQPQQLWSKSIWEIRLVAPSSSFEIPKILTVL